jgi:hypothetical protein
VPGYFKVFLQVHDTSTARTQQNLSADGSVAKTFAGTGILYCESRK